MNEQSTFSYNGGHIYYKVDGPDSISTSQPGHAGDPLVFLHGFGLDHRMWQPQVEFFSKQYQVITYDARGFGKSSTPDRQYDPADDLQALLKHLKITQAHIVGLSMGGETAINFALLHPAMARSLILLSTALDGYVSTVDWNVHAKELGLEAAKENWLKHEVFAAAREQPEVAAALRAMIHDYSGWYWLHKDKDKRVTLNARNRLHEVTAPTLVVVGERDLSYFHDIANIVAAGIAGAEEVVVPGRGHMLNMEAPGKTNNLLTGFISQHA